MDNWREDVTNDTTIIVNRLISIKNEIKKLTSKRNISLIITTIATILFIVYTDMTFHPQPNENVLFAAAPYFTNPFRIAFILFIIAAYTIYLSIQKQLNNEKTRLENLRLETIEHLKNTWYINEHSTTRDAISTDLAEHGINVRHKNP